MQDDAVYDARLELIDFVIELFHDVPDEAFVERLLAGDVALPDEEVNDDLDAGFDELRRFVAENEGRDPAVVQDELEVEFTRVFVGPRPPVLPHETAFRDDTDFIGEGLAAVEASYAAAGWSPPEEYGEENDYLAVELAFLRNLVSRQRRGEEEAVGFERVFLEEHLLVWIEEFRDETLAETDHPLLRAGALVSAGVADFEDELVAQLG